MGCVQGSGSISKYRKQQKRSEKIAGKSEKKWRKIIDGIYCYYNTEEAMFRVQGLLPNMEICSNI